MLKVGVIGLGWMGRVHLRNYTEMADVEVVGVVDVDETAREEVAAQFGVTAYATLDELLENDLDAVSVCVPTSLHHETGLAIMDKSVNVIIEKPLARTSEEGEDLVAKAKEKGVALMVGHVERFNPAVARVKELISGEDDKVISIQIERVGPYPPRIQDVGVIKDLGSHDIDLIRYLTGSEFKSVYAVCSTSIGQHEDSALITTEMENGVLANITTNWVTPYKGRMINVACENKYVKANLITQEVKEYSAFSAYDKSYSVREWPLMFREPVKEELTQFLTALRQGAPVPITGEDGLEVLKTFDKIFACID